MSPDFDPNFGNPMINPEIIKHAVEVMKSTDDFLRKCLEKCVSPETLELFVGMGSSIPGLDLKLTFFSPQRHRIQLFFNNKEIGSAMSVTEITPSQPPFVQTKLYIEKL